MAFPAGWGRKCTITIASAKVIGSETNKTLLITEDMLPSEMMDGGANSALNGGGDVRVTEDVMGATQLPLEVVHFVTGGSPSAHMHVKFLTLNSGANRTFTVWYNKSGETQPAVADTYGRNAVWSDYLFASHDGITDSTGNRTITDVGSPPTAVGNFGSDVNDYDGSSDYAYMSVAGVDLSGPISFGTWFEADAYNYSRVLTLRDSADDGFSLAINNGDGRVNLAAGSNNSATVWGGQTDGTKAAAIGAGWNFAQGVISATDGSSDKTVVSADLNGAAMALAASSTWGKPDTDQINIANRGSGNSKHNGRIGLSYIYLGELSQDWHTTEYNNQSSPATFATAGTPTNGDFFGASDVTMINPNEWIVGTTGTQGSFGHYDTVATESEIIAGVGGEPMWASISDGGYDSSGGWYGANIAVTNTDAYRSSTWVYLADSKVGSMYLGCRGGTSTEDLSGGAVNNPYFAYGDNPTIGKWYLWVGLIHEVGYSGGDTGVSGVYDPDTGLRVVSGLEFRQAAGTLLQLQRVYRYYVDVVDDTAYFARPRFEVVNGSEPSIATLLSSPPPAPHLFGSPWNYYAQL